ncbi:MAG TPA: hypothetical protein VF765_10205 [Polyangiaceae bacterium]
MTRVAIVLLVLLGAADAHAQEAAPTPPSADPHWIEFSLEGLVGGRRLSVGAFDAPLRASGYGMLPRTFMGGGFALDFSIARWRFEVPMLYTVASAPSLVDSSSVGAAVGDVSIDFGYDVVRYGDFTAFVLGGLGVSALMIDTRDAHWTWVADRTHAGSDVNTVEDDAFVLGLQLGLQQVVPLSNSRDKGAWALYLGLRGGYRQEIADVGWVTSNGDSKSVGGLPSVDVGGGWAALSIGIGAYGSRPRIATH